MMRFWYYLVYHFSPTPSVSSCCMSSSMALIFFDQIGIQHQSHVDKRDSIYWSLFFCCRDEIGRSSNDAMNDCGCLLFDGCHFEYN